MKQQPEIGMNRTGIQMSPLDSDSMQAGMPPSMKPATPGNDSALAELRSSYIVNADPLGSVPVPGAVHGALTTGVSMLAGDRPQLLLDKLGERLAFERIGTRLYDALIAKFQAAQDSTTGMTLASLQQIRQNEVHHFALVADAIDMLGGDPTAQTPCADMAGVEASGLMQVVTDPRTTIAQSLHAMLVAELIDNAGWELLVALCENQGQGSVISDFSVALDDERAHLRQVQAWLEEATIGAAASNGMPAGDAGDAGPSPSLH